MKPTWKAALAAALVVSVVPAFAADEPKGPTGSWFGRAVPFNPACPPSTPGCPIPAEIVMLPTFYADGNFLGIDSNVFVGFHSTAHGQWVSTGGDNIESNFVWLQSGERLESFIGAFRVRLVGRIDPDNRDRMIGYIQAFFFPFVDPTTSRVRLDGKGLPIPDPLGQPLPAECSPATGCLGTFNFTLRRIGVDRQEGAPPAALATVTATPNPAPADPATGFGTVKFNWTAPTATDVELRVSGPTGPLVAAGGPIGSGETGNWVRDGMTFYLQDVSGGKLLTPGNTLATVTVKLQK